MRQSFSNRLTCRKFRVFTTRSAFSLAKVPVTFFLMRLFLETIVANDLESSWRKKYRNVSSFPWMLNRVSSSKDGTRSWNLKRTHEKYFIFERYTPILTGSNSYFIRASYIYCNLDVNRILYMSVIMSQVIVVE